MAKEKITLDAIKHDFNANLKFGYLSKYEGQIIGSVIILSLTLFLNIGAKSVIAYISYLCLPFYLFSAYILTSCLLGYYKYRVKKKSVDSLWMREQISISTERFSHESTELVHDFCSRYSLSKYREDIYFNFKSGASWRAPKVFHYAWSPEARFSTSGIDNITSEGDEFIFVRMQDDPEIAYAYPCEVFELDKSLILKGE